MLKSIDNFYQISALLLVMNELRKADFELASALLRNKYKDFSLLNQLLGQNQGVKI
jgi:hypothetical protein